MNKTLRNKLYIIAAKCRRLLEEDLTQQLEGHYGLHADGKLEVLDNLGHLDAVGRADREAIEAAIRHEEASGASPREAVEDCIRQSALTLLNLVTFLIPGLTTSVCGINGKR